MTDVSTIKATWGGSFTSLGIANFFAEFRLRIGQKKFSIKFPHSRHYNYSRRGKKNQIGGKGILWPGMINNSHFPKNLMQSPLTICLAGTT
jgi:hypothetical protein